MKQISEISDAIIREREECLQSQKEMIIDLATTIAQKVIGDKLLQDESVMFSVFKQAVQNMTPCKKLIVTVSNDDYTIMTSRFDQIKSITKSFEEIEIRVDDSSEKGTLRLESAVMLIDASVNKQIGLLRKEITKAL
jgi:flagellar assembly protein FliH